MFRHAMMSTMPDKLSSSAVNAAMAPLFCGAGLADIRGKGLAVIDRFLLSAG